MRLYLIDAHSLIYQVFHAVPPMAGPKGQPTNAVYGFVGDLLRLLAKKPDYLVVVFDPPGKTFRDELYPEYKAQRSPMPDDLAVQLPVIRQALEVFRIPTLMIDGFEADDTLATVARQAAARGIEVFICSSDKDLRQLISPRIKLLNLRKNLVLDEEGLREDWGVRPDQVIDLLTLTGDSVDNVPGVPGVGVKTAAKLLQEHGTLAALLTRLPEMKKGKLKENLQVHQAKLALGHDLVKLRDDVPVAIDWQAWETKPLDVEACLAFFRECGFHRFVDEVRKLAGGEAPRPAAEKDHDSKALAAKATPETSSRPTRRTVPAAAGQGDLFAHDVSSATSPTSSAAWETTYTLVDSRGVFEQLLAELTRQARFAIDLETTSLDPRDAEIVGIALAWKSGEGYYLALKGPPGHPVLNAQEVLDQLRPILADATKAKVNQNIKYDLAVLRKHGLPLAGIAGDSMIASYLLNPGERQHNLDALSFEHFRHQPISIESLIGKGKAQKRMDEVAPARVAAYAAEDADLALRLCDLLEPKLEEQGLGALYREVEVPLIAVLERMEAAGVCLDTRLLQQLSGEFLAQMEDLKEAIFKEAGRPFNVDSPKQLREILFGELKLPKLRRTAVSGDASTSQEVLEDLAAAGHELPRLIISYRQLAKLKGTYLDALPELVHPRTGRLHCSFNQTVAATGRLSCSDPNLQNIPTRTEQGQQIRKAFIAPNADWLLLTADYSQIELRVLAHCAGDEVLIQAFKADQDIHAAVAAGIFGVAPDAVDKNQRRLAKTVNFGVIYGLSAFGLARRLAIPQEEASAFIDAYFARYPGVAAFQERILAETQEKGYVSTILGRRRWISGIRSRSSYRQRNQPEREALNSVIQGSAADLMKLAMLRIDRRLAQELPSARMLLQIHDELVFEVQRHEMPTLAKLVAEEMEGAMSLVVPLKVDLAAGANWLETSRLER